MSRFIESIRIQEQKIHLLEYHQSRVNLTFRHFGKTGSLDLKKIIGTLSHDEKGLYKLRIVYDLEGNYQTQIVPYIFGQIEDFELVEQNDIDYSFKYENRSTFKNLIKQSDAQEIIVVKNNHITDTSYANLLFLKGKKWYTPTTYLLNGVQRQHLLKKKKIKETEITLDNIREFSHVQIINAMNTHDNDFIYPIEHIINLPKDTSYLEF